MYLRHLHEIVWYRLINNSVAFKFAILGNKYFDTQGHEWLICRTVQVGRLYFMQHIRVISKYAPYYLRKTRMLITKRKIVYHHCSWQRRMVMFTCAPCYLRKMRMLINKRKIVHRHCSLQQRMVMFTYATCYLRTKQM